MRLRLFARIGPARARLLVSTRALAVAMLVLGLGGVPALAGESAAAGEPAAPGGAYCTAAARACGAACDETTEPGSARAVACEARCAVDHAACDARDALSGVEPWLRDKSEKADSFMEGFKGESGDGESGPPTRQACRSAFQRCETRCEGRHGSDEYARAGCESVCAMNRATCEAEAGVEAARPYIEREVERLRGFFDSLLGEEGTMPPPPDVPDYPETNEDGTLDL